MKHTIRYLLISELLFTIVTTPQLVQSADDHTHSNRPIPLVAGVPIGEAWKIVDRHEKEFKKTPGVQGLFVGKDEILVQITVYTNEKGEKPTSLPAQFQALPKTLEGIPITLAPIYVLPPPPGVIVLKPGGKQEKADTCPSGYDETRSYGWRFCYAHGNPEITPSLMMLPIAGIPVDEAYKILDRHRDKLMALPGVASVGMGANGISVEATNPSLLPKEVEGLPLEVQPVRQDEKH
jgi:hypothetical protein